VPALSAARFLAVASVAVSLAGTIGTSGCKPKASQEQCTELLDRYAELVVREKSPDASPEQAKAAHDRERDEARGDDNFKNCHSEVSQPEYSCAMKAATSEQLVKCLE
jgi:hypothetical protein